MSKIPELYHGNGVKPNINVSAGWPLNSNARTEIPAAGGQAPRSSASCRWADAAMVPRAGFPLAGGTVAGSGALWARCRA
jgi:hypothetical protein